ncbi:hypothetical protein AB0N07_50320 [Streptomyces sp. NPDC051172]|uniref:hypothetical protein n=1 Tax=Streptomyces sp. NPDC051172 TaxID=3155796 RepID=UPI0034311983
MALGSVLVRAVREWADTAQPDAPSGDGEDVEVDGIVIPEYRQAGAGIARTVAEFILAATPGAPGDLHGRLEAIRGAQPRPEPGAGIARASRGQPLVPPARTPSPERVVTPALM